MNRFVAFDVETANAQPTSICSIGIVVVEDNVIVEECYRLVNPVTYFDYNNIQIHGITQSDVQDAPTFGELWPTIERFFLDQFVLGHYVVFDVGCLRACLHKYKIDIPQFQIACTCILGRRVLPMLSNHKLNTIASYYGFRFLHHNALEDAKVCAKIALRYLQDTPECDTMISLLDYFKIKLKYFVEQPKPTLSFPKRTTLVLDESHPFYQKKIVVGESLKEKRDVVWQKLVNVGAHISVEIEQTTNYYVTTKSAMTTNRYKKAQAYQATYGLEIIDSKLFYQLLQHQQLEKRQSTQELNDFSQTTDASNTPPLGYVQSLRQVVGHRPLLTAGATILVFNEQHQLLLQLRSDTHTWGILGGGMELKESLEDAAKRELWEETGLLATRLRMLRVFSGEQFYFKYPNGDELYSVIALYLCEEYSGELQPQDGESICLAYFDLDQLPELESRAKYIIDWLKSQTLSYETIKTA